MAAAADVTRIFAVAPVGMGTVDLPLQQIGKTDDAVQRRPQFVTHIGEEHGLGGAGHAGRAQASSSFRSRSIRCGISREKPTTGSCPLIGTGPAANSNRLNVPSAVRNPPC